METLHRIVPRRKFPDWVFDTRRIFLFHWRFTRTKPMLMLYWLRTKNFQRRNLKTKIFTRFVQRKPEKVGIIATLIGNPEVIILDEPFANLDPTTQFRLKKSSRI
jgi:ABC-type glutathione transport system ATPase component